MLSLYSPRAGEPSEVLLRNSMPRLSPNVPVFLGPPNADANLNPNGLRTLTTTMTTTPTTTTTTHKHALKCLRIPRSVGVRKLAEGKGAGARTCTEEQDRQHSWSGSKTGAGVEGATTASRNLGPEVQHEFDYPSTRLRGHLTSFRLLLPPVLSSGGMSLP